MTELLYTLAVTHITILCVTLYLHRGQAHRSVDYHPVIEHFMRGWLWLTTGMITKEWVAVHRKHHRWCEADGDPHSPHVWGIWRVLLSGALLYYRSAQDKAVLSQYGAGTPDDWVERRVYSAHPSLGIVLLLIATVAVFGPWGLVIWAIQMIWIPLWAAGVINGLGHWWGYRNWNTRDRSTNLLPWGFLIGGEELHNNHHRRPSSPKLSSRRWEFDIGWFWIRVLSGLRLAKIKNSAV